MAGHVETEDREGIRILRLAGSVSNALTPDLRSRLRAALAQADADPGARAIVLTGAGGTFSVGLNVTAHDSPQAAREMAALITLLNESRLPVVAALEGAALGAALGLALAAHGRVATPDLRIAVPDAQLHLVPCAGLTQLLPRLGGAAVALEAMLGARSFQAGAPEIAGLFDQVASGDVLEAALHHAERLAKGGARRVEDRREGFADAGAYMAALDGAHTEAPAREGIVRAVEAAMLLPLAQGLELELLAYEDARVSRASRIARHLMVTQSRVARPARPKGAPLREIVLSGPRGPFAEVSVMALDAGWRVHLAFEQKGQNESTRQSVEQVYDGAVARGLMTAQVRADRLSRLLVGAEMSGADALFEMGGRGVQGLSAAPRVRISEGDGVHPGLGADALWLRFYAPAHVAKLCEMAAGPDAGDTAERLRAALMQAGKTVLRAAPMPGMIGRNLDWAVWRAALALVEAGHNPYAVDAGAERLGFAHGPFRQMDAEGLKAALGRLEVLGAARGAAGLQAGGLLHRLIAQGQSGARAGQGVYRYSGAGPKRRKDLDIGAASPETAAEALRAALVNEAARLLEAKVAVRASDIDLALMMAHGLPRAAGGILWQADEEGLPGLLMRMRGWRDLDLDLWTPCDGLQRMVREARGFYGRA